MNYEHCSKCGKLRRIVNRKHMLCQLCNHRRLNPNPVKQKLRPISPKKQKEKVDLINVYQNMDENTCFFCGTNQNLTNAHIIRRSYSQKLITNPDNIVKACLTCHDTLDQGITEEILKLRNLDKLIERMERLDYYYCQRFKMRLGII